MSALLVASGVLALVLPGAAPGRWTQRLAPAARARAVRAWLTVGTIVLACGLVLSAASVAVRAAGAHAAADLCHRVLGTGTSGGLLFAVLAGAGALALAWRAAASARRATRDQRVLRVEPWLGQHLPGEGHDLVILPTDTLLAYAVPGPRDQVVVSTGLLSALDDVELQAVLAHERSHLCHRHARHRSIASNLRAVLGWMPGVARSCRELELAIECWADEDAGRGGAHRAALSRALLKAVRHDPSAPGLVVGGGSDTESRLVALRGKRPRPTAVGRVAAATPMPLLLGSLSAVVVAVTAHSPHGAWALVDLCPT